MADEKEEVSKDELLARLAAAEAKLAEAMPASDEPEGTGSNDLD